MIGLPVAARRAAYLLNYEEPLPLVHGPFNSSWSWAIRYRKKEKDDAGFARPAVEFLNHISGLDRLVVFLRELTIPRKATWYVAICGWAVRVGLEAYSGVGLPPTGC